VKLTGASVFNSNYASGLLVNSQQDVSLNSITAGAGFATGNGAHGILVISGGAVSLTGANNMSGNLLDGLHVTALGDINIYYPTAIANGQHGVYVETTQGNSSLRCGQVNDNGLYGVNAAKTGRSTCSVWISTGMSSAVSMSMAAMSIPILAAVALIRANTHWATRVSASTRSS